MAQSYDALVAKVRDWANRDAETLPDSIIQDALSYANDVANRELKVPALEAVATYSPTSQGENFTIPDDLTEFISLRRTDDSGPNVENQSIVYNHKSDYRTFRDIGAGQYNFYRWTRRENQILVHPQYNNNETYELYYYRRLPALNARYGVTAANANIAGLLTELPDGGTAPSGATVGTLYSLTVDGTVTYYATLAAANAAREDGDTQTPESHEFYGNEARNWLRDEQEKILIWGALTHCFNYLGEDQMAAKYLQLFQQEIQLLNDEEGRRKVSGGNTQQNFDGFLI